MTKSSKRSAAKTRPQRHSPPTFYVDECLGRSIAVKLQADDHDARPFDEFAGKQDVEFLPVIGDRHWVLITKDKKIRKNQLEVQTILNSNVRAFVVTATDLNHEQVGQLILRAMPKIIRLCGSEGRSSITSRQQASCPWYLGARFDVARNLGLADV